MKLHFTRDTGIFLLVIAGYLILTVLFSRPLAWRFTEGYVADLPANGDGSYHFNPYHLHRCLKDGTSCFHTDLQCHPIGNSLRWNTNTPVPSLLAQIFPDTTTGFNLVLLVNYLLTAVGGYMFSRMWLRSRWLAFTAGAFFAFWIGHSAHLWHGHANLMFTAPLPFALLAFHRMFPGIPEQFNLKFPPWTSLLSFLLLTLGCFLHDLVIGGYVVIYIFLMLNLFLYRRFVFPLRWFWQAGILGGFLLGSDQLVQWLLKWGFSSNGAFFYSGSLMNLFYPHPVSAIWSGIAFPEGGHFLPVPGLDPGRVMFPGVAVWVLTITAFVLSFRNLKKIKFPWLLVFIGLCLLYMMPLFRWTSTRWIYGPFALSHFMPLWNENRCPTRFADVLALMGPIWILATVESLSIWDSFTRMGKTILAILLSGVLLAEHYPREFPFVDLKHPPAVFPLLANKSGKAVMFVPFGLVDGKRAFGKLWLEPFAYQPVHGRAMTNGLLSRIDDTTWDFFTTDSFATRLVRVQRLQDLRPWLTALPDSAQYAPLDSASMGHSIIRLNLGDLVLSPETNQTITESFILSSLGPFMASDTIFPEGHRWIRVSTHER